MDKLKPCPFCGSSARVIAYDLFDGYQGNNTMYKVECNVCGAKIQCVKEEVAVKRWNMRADNG